MRQELPTLQCVDEPGGLDFGTTGDPEADMLAASAVHPMSEAQVARLLEMAGAPADMAERMVDEGRLRVIEYRNERFYVPAVMARPGS